MHVFLNVQSIHPPLTGVGTYTLHLARGLSRHAWVDSLIYFTHSGLVSAGDLQSGHSGPPPRKRLPSSIRSVLRRLLPSSIRSALRRLLSSSIRSVLRRLPFAYEMRDQVCARALRRVRGKLKEAVYHEPNYVLVPFNGPCVVTVHDLSHIHYPQYHPVERVRHMDKRLPASLARASRVIAVSDFVRREVIAMLDVKPEKVCTVYNGIDTVFHPRSQEELQPMLERYGLTGLRYLLAVTTLEPRKNLVSLYAAFSRLSDRLKRNHPLIVVGAKGWRTEGIEQAMAPLLQKGEVRWMGYVPADDLPILYAGAHAFVFPSLYEGFGFPPLEAMASGVPVLTSASSALAEVAGDAALLVNPEDIGQLSDGLLCLLTDEEFRKRARAKGLLRAALFTWERCIDQTVQVYRSALGLEGEGPSTSLSPTIPPGRRWHNPV